MNALFDTHSLIDTGGMFDRGGKIKRQASKYLASMGKKWCAKCQRVLGVDEFGINANEADGKARYCKSCCILIGREQVRERAKSVKTGRETRKEELLRLLGGKCGRCGYDEFLAALEFHHVASHVKKFTISDHLSGTTRKSEDENMVLAEVDKCAVLCSNCHKSIAEWQDSATWEKQAVGWRLFPKDEP